jgi:hypothetical protein
LDEIDAIVFQSKAGEPSSSVSVGVNVDAVRVPVNDDLAESFFAKKKILTNPQQIFLPLLC